jgi:hypothetical protein
MGHVPPIQEGFVIGRFLGHSHHNAADWLQYLR